MRDVAQVTHAVEQRDAEHAALRTSDTAEIAALRGALERLASTAGNTFGMHCTGCIEADRLRSELEAAKTEAAANLKAWGDMTKTAARFTLEAREARSQLSDTERRLARAVELLREKLTLARRIAGPDIPTPREEPKPG
jgi:predicted  nucleic acid-binding Zn-ribbon protein